MAGRESNSNGEVGSKGKAASIFPAEKKSVKQMIVKKIGESISKANDKKKIKPEDDDGGCGGD